MRSVHHPLILWSWYCAKGFLLGILLFGSVRAQAQCGSTLLGTSGNPIPLNIGTEDQCAASSLAVPNPNASQQSNATPLACGATQQREIWFVFSATSNTTVISLYDVALANMGFIVYDAPCAANLNLVGCAGYEYLAAYTIIRGAFNTVPGNQYLVRVSRQGSNAFEGGLFGPANNMRLCGWSWIRPPDGPACEASFESGSASPEWECRYGFYDFAWNFPSTGCLNPSGENAPLVAGSGGNQAITGGDRHTIISDKLYLDPRTNFNISGVAPRGGNYSFRLGNNSFGCGAPETGTGGIFDPVTCPPQAESVRIPLTVTVDNAGFTYMFAAVLLNPQHEPAEQPRFETLITTPDGQTVSCGYFLFVAGSGLAQFNNGPDNWQYTDWTEVGLDLTPYIGLVVTIEFRVAGCYPAAAFGGGNNAGQHSAYVYLDAFCQAFEVESPAFCAGEASLEICAPDGFINYQWPAGQLGIQPPLDQQCVTVLSPVAGTIYNVNMDLITGCPTSTTIEMSGTPVTLTEDVTLCAGLSVDLTISVDEPDDEPYTFEWSDGAIGDTNTVSPSVTTTYTVITTGASGCGSAAEVTVEVEFCNHVVTGVGGETCPGGCVDLETTLTNDLFPPYTYTWSGGLPDGPAPQACPAATTIYTVTVTDANGDIATADVTVVVLPVPEVTFDVTDVSCNGGSDGTATVIPDAGTAPYSHVWNTVPQQTDATATGLAIGTYTVTTTDANGCESSADVTLVEPVVLSVSFTTTPANCGEADGSATATAAGGVALYSYAWDTAPVQNTATASAILAGPRVVTVTDANGCTVTGNTVVGSIGGAELSSTFVDASCNGFSDGEATVIAANGTEPYAYAWNTVPVQNTATVVGLVAGTYVATVTEGNGCIGFVEVIVGQPTAIVPSATSVPGSCGLPNATATASATGGAGPYTYDWTTVPPQSGITASGLLAGNYSVTVTDATGCVANTTVDVINVPGPVASFVTQDECQGDQSTFTNTSVNGVNWQWDLGDGTTSIQQNVQHLYTSSGTFSVTLIATDGGGCSDTSTVDVVITEVPTASFVASPQEGCTPVTTTFVNTGSSLGTTCLWDFGEGSTSTQCETTDHTFVQAGCYDITLTVSEAGCSSQFTAPQLVCVDPLPIAAFSITPNPVLIASPFALFTSNSVGASEVVWTFEGGQPATSTEPIVRVDYTGLDPNEFDVCLRVTNDVGCSDSACTTVFLLDELRVHVPNTFTPDGDGINELFLPVLVGNSTEDFRLSIFNRWGELIYETANTGSGWDGTMGGTKVQDGVYVWKLVVKASIGVEIREITGHVNVLR